MLVKPGLGIAVFTDGSYSAKHKVGGWAWVAIDSFGNFETSNGWSIAPTTNNRMELEAAIYSLMEIHMRYGSCDILLQSDSKYMVEGCNDKSRARNANKDLWQSLDQGIELHNEVVFEHVKGHAGNHYNELADELATEGLRLARSIT